MNRKVPSKKRHSPTNNNHHQSMSSNERYTIRKVKHSPREKGQNPNFQPIGNFLFLWNFPNLNPIPPTHRNCQVKIIIKIWNKKMLILCQMRHANLLSTLTIQNKHHQKSDFEMIFSVNFFLYFIQNRQNAQQTWQN